ncbi:hypothetical protein [Streptomyces sp. NRRL B-3648]|uniref:hypothetical protein n=1 Tax=Streptomyces sp. NRRL B-3648 TaxID=1519493 RepID=UPI0006AEC542|nr:hypothetical protein [Streptomyces sp. NRRL B-3648]KOX11662.1 lipoprotein [Streptomyces sp. NRRL B-3648]
MTRTTDNHHRPGAVVRATATSLAAALLALTLAACDGDGDSTGSAAGTKTATTQAATAQPSGSGPATGSPTVGAAPAGKSTPGRATASPAATAAPTPPAPAPAKPAASETAGSGSGCDHKMPISPDELAVYRYTPEGGALHLIVKYGAWGCAPADSDGAPFETVGKEIPVPMNQAAYVTVTNPVVASTENQHIGVQEFLDWLEAHPNSGLVFKYHLGADGAIDKLEEEFTP